MNTKLEYLLREAFEAGWAARVICKEMTMEEAFQSFLKYLETIQMIYLKGRNEKRKLA